MTTCTRCKISCCVYATAFLLQAQAVPAVASTHQNLGPLNFLIAVRRVLSTIDTNNLMGFVKDASAHEVVVVNRTTDWHTMEIDSRRNAEEASAKSGGLSLDPDHSVVWKEQDEDFAHIDLGSEEFRRVFRQFRALLTYTYRQYWSASLDMVDVYGERRLGPAFHGKLASNTHVYIYFANEHGEWKIWRLERVVH